LRFGFHVFQRVRFLQGTSHVLQTNSRYYRSEYNRDFLPVPLVSKNFLSIRSGFPPPVHFDASATIANSKLAIFIQPRRVPPESPEGWHLCSLLFQIEKAPFRSEI
jgi:hypothetical protein